MEPRVRLDESKFGGPNNLALLLLTQDEIEAMVLVMGDHYEETVEFFGNVFNDGPDNPLHQDATEMCTTLKNIVEKLKPFVVI